MNSPIELLKHGIINGNWNSIVEAHTLLTGETLDIPTNKEQYAINKCITILHEISNHWVKATDADDTSDKPPTPVKPPKRNKPIKHSKKQQRKKKIIDDGRSADEDGFIGGDLISVPGEEIKVSNRIAPGGVRKINFVTMPSHKKTQELDEKLYQHVPVPRSTRPDPFVDVVCVQCNKEEKVHSMHLGATHEYICDKCRLGRSKRAR